MTQCCRWLMAGAAAGLITTAAGIAVAQKAPERGAAQLPSLPQLDDLSDTVERPLFMSTRRPPKAPIAPVVEATPVKVPTEEAPADLTGIVNGPNLHYAILTSRSTKEVHHLREGDKIEEWSIQEIGPRYVVLRRGPGSLRLELFEEKKPGEEGNQSSLDPEDRIVRTPPNMRPRFVPRPPQIRRQEQQRIQRQRAQQQRLLQQRARQRQRIQARPSRVRRDQ